MNKVLTIPPEHEADRDWLANLWLTEWGGQSMISKGNEHRLADLEALIAWEGQARVGVATFHIDRSGCELLSINASSQGGGVGTALLQAVEEAARKAGCSRVWLITSNDNLDALRFYQRRGYRLIAVYPGAIDEARKIKPTIPQVGYHGVPIHDELELEKQLPR